MDDTRPETQDPLYYFYDGLGSVRQLIRPNGAVRDHYNYDEYGVPAPGAKLSEDGRNVNHNTFGYTGELWDEEDDLLYLRSRYYAPKVGRFLQRDVLPGFMDNPLSMHKYAYVENSPVNWVDPLGFNKKEARKGLVVQPPNPRDIYGVKQGTRETASKNTNQSWKSSVPLDTAGFLLQTASNIEKKVNMPGYVKGNVIKLLPKTEITSVIKPLQALGKVSAGVGIFATTYQVGQAFANDNLTIGQKFLKSSIIVAGAGVSYGTGIVAGALSSAVSGPLGIGVGIVATGTTSYYIGKLQDNLFHRLKLY